MSKAPDNGISFNPLTETGHSMADMYFIVDDVVSESGREGFEVMHGNPETAIGYSVDKFLTLGAAIACIERRTNRKETFARVFLARRHGDRARVRYIRPDWQFKDSRGQLTTYALACGYQERAEGQGVVVTLWYEGGVYHVRAFDHEGGRGYLSWDSFEREDIKGARKAFNLAKRLYTVAPMSCLPDPNKSHLTDAASALIEVEKR